MTVAPKQLREAAEVVAQAAIDNHLPGSMIDWATVASLLQQAAEKRDVPVGTVRQWRGDRELATYVKVSENSWEAVYSAEDGAISCNHNLTDFVVAIYPVVHKPS